MDTAPRAAGPLDPREALERVPLASSLARLVVPVAPHPLAQTLLLEPVLARLARLEHALLSTSPARAVLRARLASERTISSAAALASLAAVVRYRSQWRALAYLIAVGDVVRRTVGFLAALAHPAEREDDNAETDSSAPRRDLDTDAIRDEAQHLLSFSLLVALLSLAEQFRTTPRHPLATTPTAGFASRLQARLRAARHAYLQFLRRYILPSVLRLRWAAVRFVATYPQFDPAPLLAKLPALPPVVPSSLDLPLRAWKARRGTARVTTSFPQPSAHASDRPPRGLGPVPLAWSWFLPSTTPSPRGGSSLAAASADLAGSTGAEVRWTMVKLLLLLLGQRTDALGARNVLWRWGIEPLVGVSKRWRGSVVEGGQEEGGEWAVRLVREPRRRRRRVLPAQERPSGGADGDDEHAQGQRCPLQSQDTTTGTRLGMSDFPPVSPYHYAYAWTPRTGRVARPDPDPSPRPHLLDPSGSLPLSSAASTPRRYRLSRSVSPSPSPGPIGAAAARGEPSPASSTPADYSTTSPRATREGDEDSDDAEGDFDLVLAQRAGSPSPSPSRSPFHLSSAAAAAVVGANGTGTRPGSGHGTPVGVTYRFASANHPLLGPRSATSAGSSASSGSATAGTGTAASVMAAAAARRGRRLDMAWDPSSPVKADDDPPYSEEEDEGLMTPGEEEAEEGLRKWAGITA
ncbi:hypothetical protein JCM8202_003108 [Rhodotorula sphaerocarpa]